MSHKALVRVRIENPQMHLLRSAAREVAKELGATVEENAFVRGWSFEERVPLLITKRTRYGNGIGISVRNGRVEVVADVHGRDDEMLVRRVEERLAQWYAALAAKESLEEMGYSNVQLKREGDELLVVAEEGAGLAEGW